MAGRRTPRARLVGASQQRASDGLFTAWQLAGMAQVAFSSLLAPRSSLLLLFNLCHRVEPRQDRPAATLAKQTKQFALGFPEHTYIHLHRSPSRPVDSSEETLLSLKKILEKRSERAEQNRARLDSQLAIESSCRYYAHIAPLPSELREILTHGKCNKWPTVDWAKPGQKPYVALLSSAENLRRGIEVETKWQARHREKACAARPLGADGGPTSGRRRSQGSEKRPARSLSHL